MPFPQHQRAAAAALALLALAAASSPLAAQEPKSKKRGGLAGMMDRMNDWTTAQNMAGATQIDLSGRGLPAVAIDSLRYGVTSVAIADSLGVRVVGYLHNLSARPVTISTRVLDSIALLTADGVRLERQARLGVGRGVHTASTLTVQGSARTPVTITYAAPPAGAATGVLRVASRGAIMPIPLRAPAGQATPAAHPASAPTAPTPAPAPAPAAPRPTTAPGTNVPNPHAGHAPAPSPAPSSPAPSSEAPSSGAGSSEATFRALQGTWYYSRFTIVRGGAEEPLEVGGGTLVFNRDLTIVQDLLLGGRRHQQQGKVHVSGDRAFVTWSSGEPEQWRVGVRGDELRLTAGEGDPRTVMVLTRHRPAPKVTKDAPPAAQAAAPAPVAGTWRGLKSGVVGADDAVVDSLADNSAAMVRFAADGTLLWDANVGGHDGPRKGTWRAEGDVVTIRYEDGETRRWRFARTGDHLKLLTAPGEPVPARVVMFFEFLQ